MLSYTSYTGHPRYCIQYYSDVAIGPEANCPHAIITNFGEYVIYHNNDDSVDPPLLTCTGTGRDGGCKHVAGSTTPCGLPGVGTVAIAHSTSPAGPWTLDYPLCDIGNMFNTISNPSALIADDGSVVLALRYYATLQNGTREAIAVLSADTFLGPYNVLNRDVTNVTSEDPFIYKNSRSFHMLAHQFNYSCCPYG